MDVLLAALGAAFLAVAVAALLLFVAYRRVLRRHLLEELVRLSGPSVVPAPAPQQVMTTLLSTIYGDSDADRAFVAGSLGGEGVDPHGGDLTISNHTTVQLGLRAVDREASELILTVTHSVKPDLTDYRFAIFATCDPLLRDSITLASRLPLFESWFVPDRSLFEESIDDIRGSARLGIRYTDRYGESHDVPLTKTELTEVGYRDWPSFLRFFQESLGTMPRQNPMDYMSTLRIFECDLGELAHADHAVGSVDSVSLRFRAPARVDDGFCCWQAPYPCYVESVSFDAVDLAADIEDSLLFRVVPFTFRSELLTSGWIPAEHLGGLAVRSWLLPGHGIALLWKPSRPDSRAA